MAIRTLAISRRALTALAFGALVRAQEVPVDFLCPMDPDVRSKTPGKCPRCGMKLEAGLPEPSEYPMSLTIHPNPPRPGLPATLELQVFDPVKRQPVPRFLEIHEKLFHLFLISADLELFAHEHPEMTLGSEGLFRLKYTFRKAGEYRLLADFFPRGGTPQLISRSFYVAGECKPAKSLRADLEAKQGANMRVELVAEPPLPLAGKKTLLFFRITPHEGLEPLLGAWGHLLAASTDLIDLIHGHPEFADAGPQIQFNVIFPRPGIHRVWVQFQNKGVINTVAFNVPVAELR